MNTTPLTPILMLSTSLFFGAGTLTTQAQELKTLSGYQPTVISSNETAKAIYDSLPTKIFRPSSGCYQRAHHWSFRLNNLQSIKSMKVFLFFTERYKREFDYEWMYHVAPLIPVKQPDGSIEEMVFDPTFVTAPSWTSPEEMKFFDHRPIPIQKWIGYFIFPKVECPVVENYEDYFNYQERYYCYIMKTPMYTYIPENIESENEVRTEWREGDLLQMKKALKLEYRL